MTLFIGFSKTNRKPQSQRHPPAKVPGARSAGRDGCGHVAQAPQVVEALRNLAFKPEPLSRVTILTPR